MPDTHPQARPFLLKGDNNVAVLFIHGFTASPSELYPTAWLLHKKSGFTVCGPLLPGHGSSPDQLNRTDWREWCRAVEQELLVLQQNYDQIVVAGLSLGGLLALHAGINVPAMKGVVSINAPVIMRAPVFEFMAPLLQIIKPYWPKIYREQFTKLKKQGRYDYDCIPVKAFRKMLQLRKEVIDRMEKLNLPLLIMQSVNDESVNPRSASYLAGLARNSKVKLVELPVSKHVATMGAEKELIAREMIGFINSNINTGKEKQ